MVESVFQSQAEIVVDSIEKSKIRVLHIDDEPEFLKVAKQCLETQGPFHVDSASSAEEAMENLKKETYDAVISDYQMPGKDGIQFLKELRANRNSIPFIIFTGKGREEVAIEALNLGANQYLNKTGDPATVYCELAHGIQQAVEKNKIEEELRRFSSAVKSSLDGVVICDMSGRIIEVNGAAARTYGSTDECELIGKNCLDLLAPEERDRAMEGFKELLKEGSRTSREYTAITKSGNRLPVEISATLMKDYEGRSIGFVCIIRDTTERRKAEEKYRTLVEQSLEGIVIAQGVPPRLVFANPAMVKLSGYTPEELASVSMDRLVHPDDRAVFFSRLKDRFEGKQVPSHSEYRAIRKDGEVVWIQLSSSLIEYKGQPAVQATFINITERKKAEGELQKCEESFRALMEDAPIGVCSIDLKGEFTYVNKRFEQVMGYSREEIVGKNSFKFGIMSNETSKLLAKRMKDRLMGKPRRVSEGRFKRKDGEWIWAEVEGRLIKKPGVPVGFQLTVKDVTERKRVEEERKRFEENLSALHAYGRDLNMAESMGEIYELALNVAEKALGFECADILLFEGKTLRVVAQRGDVEKLSLELPLDGDEGITVRAARIGKPVLVPDISKDSAYVSFRSRVRVRSELAVPIKIGQRVIGVLNVESVKLDAFDEKDQKLFEILASHAATAMSNLDRAQKLDAMNEKLRVVGGLTRHDVRNKLSAITGNTHLLKKRLAGNSEASDRLGEIEKAVRHVVEIFDFARAYEMLGAEELVYIDVEKTVNEAISLFANQNNVKVVNDCHGLTVLADSLLRQLFYNLIDNSLKYGQKTARIRVCYEKTGQDSLKLVYEDDGVGIPTPEKPKLFREGYSTGGSTGYGLYLTKKIMEVYGWTIQETGTPGRGAQFTITIPKANKHGKENYQIA